MSERAVRVVASGDQALPSRLCGLLAQRAIPIRAIEFTRADARWDVRIAFLAATKQELDSAIRFIERMVDVVEVYPDGATAMQLLDAPGCVR